MGRGVRIRHARIWCYPGLRAQAEGGRAYAAHSSCSRPRHPPAVSNESALGALRPRAERPSAVPHLTHLQANRAAARTLEHARAAPFESAQSAQAKDRGALYHLHGQPRGHTPLPGWWLTVHAVRHVLEKA